MVVSRRRSGTGGLMAKENAHQQGSADLLVRSAAFRGDGRKDRGATKPSALYVVEQSTRPGKRPCRGSAGCQPEAPL
jgi:hypothetical protein